ncbi:Ankyrin repeat family protein [Abeliophyllum distichum]|uniref:Ankyrin repeat family protein n=1 Tax=Abeliophyllum distichum TaxID=126358 RepID=A0ABD1V9J5_9LAMI
MIAVEVAPSWLQPFYEALIRGKMTVVKIFLEEHETSALTERLNASGETALMVAIKGGHGHIIDMLVRLTSQELLAFQDNSETTALHAAAQLDNVKAAQLLVDKNHKLLNIVGDGRLWPIHLAAIRGHREMTSYLFYVGMKDEFHSNLLKDSTVGERLMLYLVTARFYGDPNGYLKYVFGKILLHFRFDLVNFAKKTLPKFL